MMRPNAFVAIATLAGLFQAAPGSMFAQGSTAQIMGRITDASEAVVPGAQIKVTAVQTRKVRETTSNGDGYYTVSLLDPGEYRLTVEAAGFQSLVRSGILLQVNQAARLDLQLELGGCRAVGGSSGAGATGGS